MTNRGERPPSGPYGPGWNGDEDAHWEDWGASADRPRPPKALRNISTVMVALTSISMLFLLYDWWSGNEVGWSQVLLPVSQLLLAGTFYLQYRQTLKGHPTTTNGEP